MIYPTHGQPWRLRLTMLVLLLALGLGVSAVEKWREDEVRVVWNHAYGLLRHYLNPIREYSYKPISVLFRFDNLWRVEEKNQQLQRTLTESRLQNQLLTEEVGRLRRLSGLGHWTGPGELRFLSADVIGLITSEQNAALTINRGRLDGVRPRDPVVALGGLVGLVTAASDHTARVQAVMDPLSAVGAVVRESRARGILYGQGRNKPLAFMPENEVQPVDVNAVLTTSGFENSVFPKGVVIGVIKDRKLNPYGMPYGVVKPAVAFESLEEVLLVLPRGRNGRIDEATTGTLGRYEIGMPVPAAFAEDLGASHTQPAALRENRPASDTALGTGTMVRLKPPADTATATSRTQNAAPAAAAPPAEAAQEASPDQDLEQIQKRDEEQARRDDETTTGAAPAQPGGPTDDSKDSND